MITLTDWAGKTLTIPADADGATTATWRDDDDVILTANAWWWAADRVLFLPADCQGREDATIDSDGAAIGSWVNGTDGTPAVVFGGAPRAALIEPRKAGRPAVGGVIQVRIPAGMLADIDATADAEGVTRSAWIRQALAARLHASRIS